MRKWKPKSHWYFSDDFHHFTFLFNPQLDLFLRLNLSAGEGYCTFWLFCTEMLLSVKMDEVRRIRSRYFNWIPLNQKNYRFHIVNTLHINETFFSKFIKSKRKRSKWTVFFRTREVKFSGQGRKKLNSHHFTSACKCTSLPYLRRNE